MVLGGVRLLGCYLGKLRPEESGGSVPIPIFCKS